MTAASMRVPLSLVVQLSQRLDEELQGIALQLLQSKEGAGVGVPDPTSVGRILRMDPRQPHSMMGGEVHRLRIRQKRVLAAKSRLLSGTFGECSACERLIDLNRLIADPASPYCNECQAYIDAQP